MHRTLAWPAALAVAAACVASARAGQSGASQGTFRTGVELVQLDVVVRDRDNRPVRGLTREDFEIVEPGHPEVSRRIASFEEIHHDPAPPSLWPRTMPLDVADNRSAIDDRLIVFAIDDTHVRAEYTEELRRTSADAIERLGPGATMVLLTTSGRHRVEATNDPAVLLAEASRITGWEERYVVNPPLEIRTDGPHPLTPTPPTATQEFQSNFAITLNALGDAARALTTASARRKALVWISNGTNQLGGKDTKFLAGLLEKMRRADVVTYAIDPLGTKPPMPGGSYGGVARTGEATPWDGLKRSKSATLATISRLTGGFALFNDDDIRGGIERVAADLDNYYLLGFYPDPRPSGYQPVVVRVKRPGVTVRHRDGYDLDAATAAAAKSAANPLAALGATGVPVAEFPLRLFAAAVPDGVRARVPVLISLGGDPPPSATFDLTVVDQDRMKVVGGWRGTAPMRDVTTSVSLAPGRYQLRAFVAAGGRKASVFAQIRVPDFNLRSTSIALGHLVVGRSTAQPSAGSFPITATTDRTFDAGERLRLYAGLSARSAVTARLSIVDAADAAVREIEPSVSKQRIETALDLAGLAPGAYRLRLTVTSGATQLSREVGIVVK